MNARRRRAAAARRAALRWLVAVLLGLVALVAVPAVPASAHASLLSSDPAPGTVLATAPSDVRLVFDEPVTPAVEGVRLVGVDGSTVVLGARAVDGTVVVTLPTGLAEGSWLLSWRVVSADAHPVSGVLGFAVGAPSPEAPPVPAEDGAPVAELLLTGARALTYGGVLALVGLVLVRTLVLRESRPGRAVPLAALVAGAGAVLAVPLEWLAVQAADPAALLGGGLLDAASGASGVAAALTVAGAVLGVVGSRSGGPAGWVRWPGIALAVTSLAVVGHTRTYQPTWLVVAADLAHVLAGALWSGGLLALLLWWRSERGPSDVLTVVSRFSTAAAVSVLVLAATGTTMAVLVLERWSGVLQTAYGRALVVKLALVAAVLAIAGWNRLVLVPRLRRGEAPEVAPRLRRSMVDEVALLAAVAVFTGVLTSASPVPDDHGGHGSPTVAVAPAPQRLDLGEVEAEVLLSPARRGPNEVAVELRDDAGPVEVEQPPTVSLTLPGQVGPLQTRLEPTGTPGEYRGPVDVPLAGRWDLAVAVRLDRFTEPVGVVAVDVG
ncbi:hypothetical protein DT076_16190 [Desertihabitans brevis]|uniref:Copper resistance protein CopC n=1 Tax=Desertihabitans brevis TaxID=2268447 RepID=A0A367YTZ3_9ACTN|nr:copper resistance protein CopC [Desertihabitans brevis]RCK68451.1 hypothetical protein DT076_16190 [Desertihabitans brevis]